MKSWGNATITLPEDGLHVIKQVSSFKYLRYVISKYRIDTEIQWVLQQNKQQSLRNVMESGHLKEPLKNYEAEQQRWAFYDLWWILLDNVIIKASGYNACRPKEWEKNRTTITGTGTGTAGVKFYGRSKWRQSSHNRNWQLSVNCLVLTEILDVVRRLRLRSPQQFGEMDFSPSSSGSGKGKLITVGPLQTASRSRWGETTSKQWKMTIYCCKNPELICIGHDYCVHGNTQHKTVFICL